MVLSEQAPRGSRTTSLIGRLAGLPAAGSVDACRAASGANGSGT